MRRISELKIFRLNAGIGLCLLLLVLSFVTFGRQYTFKTYSLEDGLPQSQARCFFLDSKGYLWIGTYGGGLSRFDGNSFTNYTTKDGLNGNSIYSIYEDRTFNLWIGTDNGVNKFDGKHFTVFTTKDGLSHNSIRGILEDEDGLIRIATYGGGVDTFDGTTFRHYTTKDGLVDNRVNCIMLDSRGNFWFGTEKGAAKFNGKTVITVTTDDGFPGEKIRSILEDGNGRLWFATDKGACRLDGTSVTPFTTREGLCNNDVRAILEDSDGHMWFTTADGVSRYDGSVFTTYTTLQGLSYNLVLNIMEDRENNIWLATDLGLTKLTRSAFKTITHEDGLNDNTVWSLWDDHKGNVWIATEKGIALYSNQKRPAVTLLKNKIKTSAYPFYEDQSGGLWMGTAPGLMLYKDGIFTDLSKQAGMEEKEIFSIFEDRRGNIWLGTRLHGVTRFDGRTATVFTSKEGLIDNLVNSIAEDKYGRLWFGTANGIGIFDGHRFTSITTENWLNNRFVNTILMDPGDAKGTLWIGTFGGGVTRCEPSQDPKNSIVETFTSDNGLEVNEILLMIFGNNGHLWLGTNKGISALDVAEYKKTGRKVFTFYGKEDGFTGMECNQNAVCKDREGNLWFGTIKGATRYNPKEDTINTVEPSTLITGLKLYMEPVDLSIYSDSQFLGAALPTGLKLPHDQNHVTLEFIGISFTVPEKVRYQFKLDGFDQDWSPETKATYVTYSNLSPGNYTFMVKARNNSGLWNKEPVTYEFTIQTPFTKTWLFYLLCVIGGMVVVSAYIKIHTRNLKKQRRILEEKVHIRTLELEDEKAKVERVNLELEERVRERTEKLADANKQLVQAQKLEAIGTLAGGVAHDLNNVLAGIISYPELMLMKLPEDSPLRKYLVTIKTSGEKAAAMVQDLLTLARRGVEVREILNPNAIISETLASPEIGKLRFYHPNVNIETSLKKNVLNITGSLIHVSKTIINLVSNATEAMHNGGTVFVSTENRYMEPNVSIKGYDSVKEGDYVVFSVSDTGVGISEEDIERIFEPFYTKKEMGRSGTGLGMTVVWSTVQDHNGYITVDSIENKGTTITIYFPGTRQEPEREKFRLSLQEYMGNGETILAVDDVLEQRDVITLMLTELGYSVKTVSSGEEALEYILKNPVSLVVLDMIMDPGIDGFETYKRILEHYPHQKAIIVSGYSETERVKETLKLGAGAYVKKPYLMEEIGMAIKRELRR